MPCHLLNRVGTSFQPARVQGRKKVCLKKKPILNDLFWRRDGVKEVFRISRLVVKHIERLLNWWYFYIGQKKEKKKVVSQGTQIDFLALRLFYIIFQWAKCKFLFSSGFYLNDRNKWTEMHLDHLVIGNLLTTTKTRFI